MHSLLKLSFSAPSANGTVDLWPETPSTGDHATDNDTGRWRADELVAYMQKHKAPMVFGHVVARIAERQVMGALETGFLSQMALHAMAQPQIETLPAAAADNVVPFVRPATSRR